MIDNTRLCPRQLTFHAVLGALWGATAVFLLLAFNVAGLGTMIGQAENTAVYLAMMFMKPAMLFGAIALGWSVFRQVRPEIAKESSRLYFSLPQADARAVQSA